MRTLCLVAAALAVTASSSLAGETASAPGLIWSSHGAVLTEIDPISRLALPQAPAVRLGYARYSLSASPDGALLASTSGMDRDVHLSALDEIGRTWTIGPLPGRVGSTFWIGRRTLAVGTGDEVTLVDVEPRRARPPIPVGGTIIAEAAAGGRYVALVAPQAGFGALNLVSVRASGAVRIVAVPALRGGHELGPHRAARAALPGLALSPGGKLAYVVPRGNRIVAANLATGRVRVIVVRTDRTLQAAAKALAGWQRTSALAGSGTLVTTGGDLSGREYASFLGGTPAGLRITDLDTRRTHVAVPSANQFRICGSVIVAAGAKATAGSAGVVALDRKGRPRWSKYAGAAVMLAGCTRDYVYLWIPGSGFATLDTRTGAVLDEHRGSAATAIPTS